MKKLWIVALLVVGAGVVIILAGTGTRWLEPLGLGSDEQLLRWRVDAYWQGRVDGDLEAIAKYQHPEQKGIAKPDMLVTDSYDVLGVEIKGDEATATVSIHSHLNHPQLAQRARELRIEDKWVRQNGRWYRALRPETIVDILRKAQQQMHPEAETSRSALPGQK